MKNYFYILAPVLLTVSVAKADLIQEKGPLLLSDMEMDKVTAGAGGSTDAQASAFSYILAIAKTFTTANVAATGDDSGLTGVGVATGGLALAAGAGDGAVSTTSVTPSTDLSGGSVSSLELNISASGQLVSMSGGAIVAVSSPTQNPL